MSPPATHPDAYPLKACDRVFDRKQVEEDDEVELAIVIDTVDEDVYERTFTSSDGEEVALASYEPNRAYADFDESERVVTIAFAGWLERNIDGWEDDAADPAKLRERIAEFHNEWSVSPQLFDYPEARLMLSYRPTNDDVTSHD